MIFETFLHRVHDISLLANDISCRIEAFSVSEIE